MCVCVCVRRRGGWRLLGEGTVSETQQNNEGPAKVDRAWQKGTLTPLSPFGSEPPGQRQHCVGVRPLWMKGPALYSRIQALCRVGVQGREKIATGDRGRMDTREWRLDTQTWGRMGHGIQAPDGEQEDHPTPFSAHPRWGWEQ